MIATILPGKLSGKVKVPASKSAAHRMFIAAALSNTQCGMQIEGVNRDIEATVACLEALGAVIDRPSSNDDQGFTAVQPIPGAPAFTRPLMACLGYQVPVTVDFSRVIELDCGESGSTLRFLLPLACALGVKARFVGRGRLPERPNQVLTDVLRAHGATIDSDLLPMNVSGHLEPGAYSLPGNISSQYITGLLFALPLLDGDSEIILTTKLESAAYVDMTLQALRRFHIHVEPTERGWRVPGNQVYRPEGYHSAVVEGDWSAAAFWLAANRMGSDIQVTGLSEDTAQGDRAVTLLLGRPLIDASGVPDLVPALAVAAASLPQRTVITGAARLRLKESDRLAATADLINALGGRAEATEDGLVIDGGQPLHGGRVDGRNDHRIVMAAAIAATVADGPVTVADAEAVAKSYPDFFKHFNALGGHAHVEPLG